MKPLRHGHRLAPWKRGRAQIAGAIAFALALLAGPPAQAAEATEPTSADESPTSAVTDEAANPVAPDKEQYFYLEAYWQEGINYAIKQRLLSVEAYRERKRRYGFAGDALLSGRIGFRIAADAAAYVERDGLSGIDDDIDLRRAFVYFTGDFFLVYPASFKVEVGTITDDLYVSSAWVRWRELPYVGTFKIGQYDAPFGLEAMGSSNDLTFMEQGSPSQAFAPGTKFGLQIGDTELDEKLTWAFGWFADTQDNDVGDAGNSLARLIARLTYLPVDQGTDNSSDRRLLHLGLGIATKYARDQGVRYQSKPESFLAPVLVDTDDLDSSTALVVGGESAWVRGPFSLQGEVDVAYAGGTPGADPLFWGVYGQGSLLLTGESRPYSRQSGTFGHLQPHHPFHPLQGLGWGAWEVGGRYSYVDLDDGDVGGGTMHGLTAGLNWYWSRYVRWQFNYQFMIAQDGTDDGRLHIFQARIQLVI